MNWKRPSAVPRGGYMGGGDMFWIVLSIVLIPMKLIEGVWDYLRSTIAFLIIDRYLESGTATDEQVASWIVSAMYAPMEPELRNILVSGYMDAMQTKREARS